MSDRDRELLADLERKLAQAKALGGVPVPQDGCVPCWAAWHRWLDYQPPPPPIRLDGTGNRTVRDVQMAQERRYQDWRETVHWHQDHIARLCREGRHAPERGSDERA